MKEVISAREAHRIAMTSGDVIFNATVSAINDIIVKACVDWKFLPPDLRDTLIAAYTVRGYAVMPDGLDSNDLWVSWRDDK